MSQRQDELLALAGRLADDFATRAAQHDRDNSFPAENIEALKQAGYTALIIPERLGGLGADLLDFVLCQERLARGCGPTALAINMHLFGLGSMLEHYEGRPEQEFFFRTVGAQRKIVGGGLSEPESGGDWGLFATRARREGNFYILNGRKAFTSLSPVIDFFLILATLDEPGPPATGTFIVPRGMPGLELVESWDAMGMRATASHDLILRDLKVGAEALTERRTLGAINREAVSLFAWFSFSIAAIYTGIASAAFDFTRRFAAQFRPFSLPRPIAFLPAVQFAAAEAQALLAQSRALYLSTTREYLEHREAFAGEAGLARVVLTKYVATNNAVKVLDYCMEIAGAHGFLRRHPLERLFRDVHAGPHHPLSNGRARELLGKQILDIPLATMPRW